MAESQAGASSPMPVANEVPAFIKYKMTAVVKTLGIVLCDQLILKHLKVVKTYIRLKTEKHISKNYTESMEPAICRHPAVGGSL